MNHNLCHRHDSPAQWLFNALEPGTVLPVHRHCNTDETYLVVRGSLKVLLYNAGGNQTESVSHMNIPETASEYISLPGNGIPLRYWNREYGE